MNDFLDKGGFARVSINDSNQDIVRKELLLNWVGNSRVETRFKREIETLLQFDSKYIVDVLDYDKENFRWYEMPRYKFSLVNYCMDLDEKSIFAIASNLIESMLEIDSKGMVHRDLKPANILINSLDDMVVCDFGLTKVDRNTKLTKTNHGLGTEYFTADEQWEDAKRVDIRADIFSFGRILIWLFTGECTFNIENSKIPLNFRSLIDKCTHRSKNERYQTVQELKNAFLTRVSPDKSLNREQIVNNIIEDENSYVNMVNIEVNSLNRFTEDELYNIICKGQLRKWLNEDFSSFKCFYEVWEKKRDAVYRKRRFYNAGRADSIALNFEKYIIDTDLQIDVRVYLFQKLVNHWGNRYSVMRIIFDILTEGKCDDYFYSYLIDSLSDDDFYLLKSFYDQVGSAYGSLTNYIIPKLED